ncbi:larval cuticle protein A3A [Fopius arisanus]|uniref:Larval cuticle protein A3A n=2 Tax=Fopius arisanus TaxID=64838 RepID=A0A9R1T4G6_9HYME|nr:PREDICTED: larval cuticle protein A3A-like [Fopius arisanus]
MINRRHHKTKSIHTESNKIYSAMVFKFVSLFAVMAVANAGFIPATPLAYAAAPIAKVAAAPLITKTIDAEYDPHPQYSYAYDVQDSLTGDFKNQHETRDGDLVQGSYSLLEADGTRRTVDYTADPINGFNAVVRKEPAAVAVKAAPIAAAPLAYAQPAYTKLATPIAHAPIAYTAPLAKIATPLAYAAPAAYTKVASAPLGYAPGHFAYSAPAAYAAAPVHAALPAYLH